MLCVFGCDIWWYLLISGGDTGDAGDVRRSCDVFDDDLDDDINDDYYDHDDDIQVLQEGLSQHLRGSQRKGNRGDRSATSSPPPSRPTP